MTDPRHPDGYVISTDPARIDPRAVWEFLRTSYWSPGVEFEVVDRAIDNSLPFVLLAPGGELAGFGRAVTDRARLAGRRVRAGRAPWLRARGVAGADHA